LNFDVIPKVDHKNTTFGGFFVWQNIIKSVAEHFSPDKYHEAWFIDL